MTLSTTANRQQYTGNGSTTEFSFPNLFLANADLVVLVVTTATEASVTQVLDTDYTVTGAGLGAGGTVTMIVAPAATETLVIYRDADPTQETDYTEGDAFPAETHETALDKLTVLVQQLESEMSRAAKLLPSYLGSSDPALPSPVALEGIRWNAAADALETYASSGGHDAVTLAGTPDYLTLSGQVLTRNQIDVTTDITGVVPIANLATGTPDGTKFIRDDGTLVTPAGGGGGGLANIVEDTTPQLGGDLDLNGNVITGLVIGTDVQAYNAALTGTTATFTTADETKLDGIEAGATADQSNAEIRAAVEAATDSNVFTDADHTKLNGIEALADVTDETNVISSLDGATITEVTAVDGDFLLFQDTSDSGNLRKVDWADLPGAGGGLSNIVEDVTPQLGGDLDLNGNVITGMEIGTDIQAFSSVLAATTASFLTADETKLDGIESGADVTDATNVTAAGAVMDSEVTNLSGIKTLTVPDSTTISTFGASLVDDASAAAARTTLGVVIGTDVQAYSAVLAATTASFLTADETKLDGITAGANVTTTNTATLTNKTIDDGQYNGSQTSTLGTITTSAIDCSSGVFFEDTVAGAVTYTLTGIPASPNVYVMRLRIVFTSGSVTWTNFTNLEWAGGTAPSFSGGSEYDIILSTDDAGANWRGIANEGYS